MRSRPQIWLAVLVTAAALTVATAPAATGEQAQGALPPPSDAVTAWNAIAGQAAIDACLAPSNNPLHESRMYAAMHIAIHDALNAIERRSDPYVYSTRTELPGASPDAAIARAARDVLVTLIGQLPAPFSGCAEGAIAGVTAAYRSALADIPGGVAKDQGVRLGRAAAQTILALRADDGSDTLLFDESVPDGTAPGEYRRTPNCPPEDPSCTTPFTFVFARGWADVTPFALTDGTQYRPHRPYDVTSSKYAADLNEVKTVGSLTSSTRTADQTEIARFWYESAPLQWNRIARTVSAATPGLTVWDTARLFGLLNIAMADGYIGSFETKRFYSSWRPVTAIRSADTDGNPATTSDPAWTPLLPTPPIPSYDSAHAAEGAAAAAVMRRFFGDDDVEFTTCSLTLPAGQTCADGNGAVLRSYDSFSGAAAENGLSRILVGIHFRQDVDEGLRHGRRIADRVVGQVLRPGH